MNTEIKKFSGIINDRIFKVFFKHKDTLIDFINSYFDFIGSNKKVKFASTTPQVFIMPNNVKKKDFYGDILATLDNDELILIEAYTTFNKNEYKKSTCYNYRLYSNQMNFKDKSYLKCKKCICLNLMTGNYQNANSYLVNRHITKHFNTNEVMEDSETELVLIRLDLVNNSLYSDSNKRFIRWLKIINAKSFEEMVNFAKGDKIMNDSIEYLKWYHKNLDHGFQDVIDEVAYEVEEKTRKEERRETKLDIAKNLLSLNININDIMKATGLSEKQIKKLQS